MSLLRTRAPLFSSPPCPTHGGPYFFSLGHVGPWGTIWFSSYIGLVDRANRPQNLVQTVFIQPASVEVSCFQEGPVRPCPRNVRALKSAFFAILPRPSPRTTTTPPSPLRSLPLPPSSYLTSRHNDQCQYNCSPKKIRGNPQNKLGKTLSKGKFILLQERPCIICFFPRQKCIQIH